jgi:hypothetical protein
MIVPSSSGGGGGGGATQRLAGPHIFCAELESCAQQPDWHSSALVQFAAHTSKLGLATTHVEPGQQPWRLFVQAFAVAMHIDPVSIVPASTWASDLASMLASRVKGRKVSPLRASVLADVSLASAVCCLVSEVITAASNWTWGVVSVSADPHEKRKGQSATMNSQRVGTQYPTLNHPSHIGGNTLRWPLAIPRPFWNHRRTRTRCTSDRILDPVPSPFLA